MKYYPIHMHLHCSHEASASLNSHVSIAKSLGIEHIWTTEHDTRIGKPKGKYFSFAFPEKSLYVVLPNGRRAGFQVQEDSNGKYVFNESEQGLSLCVLAEQGEKETLFFHSKGKKHSDPLFSRLTVEMDSDIEIKAGDRYASNLFYRRNRLPINKLNFVTCLGKFRKRKMISRHNICLSRKNKTGNILFDCSRM